MTTMMMVNDFNRGLLSNDCSVEPRFGNRRRVTRYSRETFVFVWTP